MARIGGTRAGAGRPRGSVTKRSSEVLARAMAAGQSPLEFMLAMLRDNDADPKMRAWAAEKSAPYMHSRPAPTQRMIHIDLPDTTTAPGMVAGIGTILRAAAVGSIAPSEAQSLVAVLEAQRRAVETGELLERIEQLEQRASK